MRRRSPVFYFKETKTMGRFLMAVAVVMAVLGLAATFSYAGDVKIALNGDNTKVGFVGTKPGGKHIGGFKTLTGTATYDGKDATTLKFTVDIDMSSTFTDNNMLTDHLKSPDFFNVKVNPMS